MRSHKHDAEKLPEGHFKLTSTLAGFLIHRLILGNPRIFLISDGEDFHSRLLRTLLDPVVRKENGL